MIDNFDSQTSDVPKHEVSGENGSSIFSRIPLIGSGNHQETTSDTERTSDKQDGRHIAFLVVYYSVLLFGLLRLFFDVWTQSYTIMFWLGIDAVAAQDPLFRTVGFVIVGGALGSILYSIRTMFKHYIDGTYDHRWFGKYFTAPFEGAVLAVIVLALLRGGVALLGLPSGAEVDTANNFAIFGINALVGFSMRNVIGWIGRIAESIFGDTSTQANPVMQPRKPAS